MMSPPTIPARDESIDKKNGWPIVTGYGAYASSMPSIVNGQQWMTALEESQAFCTGYRRGVRTLQRGAEDISGLRFVDTTTVGGQKTPTIQEDTLAVSAYNLKNAHRTGIHLTCRCRHAAIPSNS